MVFRFRPSPTWDEFSEYTMDELIDLYHFHDAQAMMKQYQKFHDLGAVGWDEARKMHLDLQPFSEYVHLFDKKYMRFFDENGERIPNVGVADYIDWPKGKIWGEQRSPKEAWQK